MQRLRRAATLYRRFQPLSQQIDGCMADGEDLEHFLGNGKAARQAMQASGMKRVAPGIELYHEIYSLRYANGKITEAAAAAVNEEATDKPEKVEHVLMIMGFAAPGEAWLATIHSMLKAANQGSQLPLTGTLEICIFDNRGIGKSSVPESKTAYSTSIMAADAYGLMGALGWKTAHIVGFSMGGMIATKLASHQPHCVQSLTLVSVTGGGWQIIPLTPKAIRNALKSMRDKSDYGRATTDVKFHFSKDTRRTVVGSQKLGDLLVAEYIASMQETGRQHPHGEAGHFNACWTHEVTPQDVKNITSGGFPVKLIHGNDDLIAMTKYAAKLASRLGAELVLVDGGHFIPRECASKVCNELLQTFFSTAKDLEGMGQGRRVQVFATDSGAPQRRPKPQAGCLGCCA